MSNKDIIRHEQNCQIIKEISGSDEYLIVGIDVAKEKHHAFMESVGCSIGPAGMLESDILVEKLQQVRPDICKTYILLI